MERGIRAAGRVDASVREELRDAAVVGRDARGAQQELPRFAAISGREVELGDSEEHVDVIAMLLEGVLRGLREGVGLHGARLGVLREGRQQFERVG